jgi:UrcA family protein
MKIAQHRFRVTPLLLCGLATVAVSFAGGTAFAASQKNDTYSIKVQYNPLELSTQAGAESIYGKIKIAARRVCSMTSEPWDLARTRHFWQCYNTALAKAVDDVNSKNLTALHQLGSKQKHPG